MGDVTPELQASFIRAATWHGPLEEAESMLGAHPGLAVASIHTAAILGDADGVRRFLAEDPSAATATAPPYGGDPLVHLCLSRYLRLDRSRTPGFVAAATALLDAGADPNGGFWTTGTYPERETALYGAAGVAHHPELTRLLLERGADPNDPEVAYHSPEGYDDTAMKLVVESGRLTAESLALMLIRKHDWHDYDGARYLLERGADPNRTWGHGLTAMGHAVARDNRLALIELVLDHGGDPSSIREGRTVVALAARRGRGDVLALLEKRGMPIELAGVDRLIAACARGDHGRVRTIVAEAPGLVGELVAEGGTLLAEFAGNDNVEGVRALLDLGVDVAARYGGDGYFGIPPGSTALHVAAWKGWHRAVALLVERGAPVDAVDGNGSRPLELAVKACVDSYWIDRRQPDSIRTLLEAGASPAAIRLPTGYPEADLVVRRFLPPHPG